MEYIFDIPEEVSLSEDILLSWKSTSGKQGHFLTQTLYQAETHRVVHQTTGTVRRLWGLLPPKQVEHSPEYLELPRDIATEEEIRAYVRQHKKHWLNERRR